MVIKIFIKIKCTAVPNSTFAPQPGSLWGSALPAEPAPSKLVRQTIGGLHQLTKKTNKEWVRSCRYFKFTGKTAASFFTLSHR